MESQKTGDVKSDTNRNGSLNFKVDLEFKRSFKAYAANRGLTMVELLKEGFSLSQEKLRE